MPVSIQRGAFEPTKARFGKLPWLAALNSRLYEGGISLDKEQLIKFAEELYQEAFAANAYFLIMQQYREMQKEYLSEVSEL